MPLHPQGSSPTPRNVWSGVEPGFRVRTSQRLCPSSWAGLCPWSHCRTQAAEGGRWAGSLIVRGHTRDAVPGTLWPHPQWAWYAPHPCRQVLGSMCSGALRLQPVLMEGRSGYKMQSQKGTAVEHEPPQLLFRAWKGAQFSGAHSMLQAWCGVWDLYLTLWHVLGPFHR